MDLSLTSINHIDNRERRGIAMNCLVGEDEGLKRNQREDIGARRSLIGSSLFDAVMPSKNHKVLEAWMAKQAVNMNSKALISSSTPFLSINTSKHGIS